MRFSFIPKAIVTCTQTSQFYYMQLSGKLRVACIVGCLCLAAQSPTLAQNLQHRVDLCGRPDVERKVKRHGLAWHPLKHAKSSAEMLATD